MSPWDLIVWSLALGLCVIVICFGIAVGVVLIETARHTTGKKTSIE